MRVWIDKWQSDCCGEPISVGDRVTLAVRPPDAWMDVVLGDDAATIDAMEHRHGDATEEVRGRVEAIDAVAVRYGATPDGHRPVPGTTVRTPCRAVPSAASVGVLRTVGYVVLLHSTPG